MGLPVLVGAIPLTYVQSMSISEGYLFERIAGSKFSQAIAPITKTISIEAMLVGPKRLGLKKGLEAMALTSRRLVAAAAPRLAIAGIPVVSGLTIALDMQITDLRFSQSVQKREALDVNITLQHVPRSKVMGNLSEVADLALAAGTAAVSSGPPPNAIARKPKS